MCTCHVHGSAPRRAPCELRPGSARLIAPHPSPPHARAVGVHSGVRCLALCCLFDTRSPAMPTNGPEVTVHRHRGRSDHRVRLRAAGASGAPDVRPATSVHHGPAAAQHVATGDRAPATPPAVPTPPSYVQPPTSTPPPATSIGQQRDARCRAAIQAVDRSPALGSPSSAEAGTTRGPTAPPGLRVFEPGCRLDLPRDVVDPPRRLRRRRPLAGGGPPRDRPHVVHPPALGPLRSVRRRRRLTAQRNGWFSRAEGRACPRPPAR